MQMVSSPALIAGLPPLSAMVCVGPPLLASPPGSSSGFVLQNEVPVGGAQLKPHVVLSSMLCPPSVMVPADRQLPPVLWARMLLTIVTAAVRMAPPPPLARLSEKVLLVTVSLPPFAPPPAMAPPWKAL